MPADQHEIEAIAEAVRSELAGDAAAIAPTLLREVLPDTERVSRPYYLRWVREHWVREPGFAQRLLDRLAPAGPTGARPAVGLQRYLSTVREAFREAPDAGPPALPAVPATPVPTAPGTAGVGPVPEAALPPRSKDTGFPRGTI